ncbi:hypothetical protein EG329_000160 [Mollisiaceae sp. DMI_Dod_QoI]|nr:hypothetical protein EG329_000160 [Helotiales sp. DMI_Dod_QoI]
MVNIVLKTGPHPATPHPSVGMKRPIALSPETSPPSNPAKKPKISNQPSLGGKTIFQPEVYQRRRTREHVKKLNDINPYIDWVNEEGLQFKPRNRRSPTPPYSPKYSLDWQGDNFEVFEDEFDLDLGEPAIAVEEKLVTSHLVRNFHGEKMWWAREDWEENCAEVLKEEERIREKRKRERKERERNGGMSASQRRRKWRESRKAALIKKEEEDVGVKMEVKMEFETKVEVDAKTEIEVKAESDVKSEIKMKSEEEVKTEVKTEIGMKRELEMKTEFETKDCI